MCADDCWSDPEARRSKWRFSFKMPMPLNVLTVSHASSVLGSPIAACWLRHVNAAERKISPDLAYRSATSRASRSKPQKLELSSSFKTNYLDSLLHHHTLSSCPKSCSHQCLLSATKRLWSLITCNFKMQSCSLLSSARPMVPVCLPNRQQASRSARSVLRRAEEPKETSSGQDSYSVSIFSSRRRLPLCTA